MAWIESHQELAHHPKVARLAHALDISVPAAIGHLHCLWWWCLSYAEEGNLDKFSSFEIAHACQWTGDPDLFVHALADAEWIEGDLMVVHDWWDYAGKLVERRRADAERKRNDRAKTSTVRPPDVQTDGVRTQQHPTQQNRTAAEPSAFAVFHRDRAAAEVQRRKAEGTKVKNAGGLALTIAGDRDFISESERIWKHRNCPTCNGSGSETGYSPGSGGWSRNCTGEVE